MRPAFTSPLSRPGSRTTKDVNVYGVKMSVLHGSKQTSEQTQKRSFRGSTGSTAEGGVVSHRYASPGTPDDIPGPITRQMIHQEEPPPPESPFGDQASRTPDDYEPHDSGMEENPDPDSQDTNSRAGCRSLPDSWTRSWNL